MTAIAAMRNFAARSVPFLHSVPLGDSTVPGLLVRWTSAFHPLKPQELASPLSRVISLLLVWRPLLTERTRHDQVKCGKATTWNLTPNLLVFVLEIWTNCFTHINTITGMMGEKRVGRQDCPGRAGTLQYCVYATGACSSAWVLKTLVCNVKMTESTAFLI